MGFESRTYIVQGFCCILPVISVPFQVFTLEKEENNNFGVTQRAPELLLKVHATLVFTSYLCGGPNLAVHRERGVKTSMREMAL